MMYGSTRLVRQALKTKSIDASPINVLFPVTALCLFFLLLLARYQRLSTNTVLEETLINSSPLHTWKIYLDLQCPYSKIVFDKIPQFRQHFGSIFQILIQLQAIPFHLSAFQANMGATYVKRNGGLEAYEKYIGFCYESQQDFLNSKTMDMTHRQIYEMFAKKALRALDREVTPDEVSKTVDEIIKYAPDTYAEFKDTIQTVNFGAPKFVVEDVFVSAASSHWGTTEWANEFIKMGLL